jgi:hypothetical protein
MAPVFIFNPGTQKKYLPHAFNGNSGVKKSAGAAAAITTNTDI